jgi:hypothetical protein
MAYIRVARAENDKEGAETFVILVAPDELHATITLTGAHVYGPFTEAAARERLAQLRVSEDDIESLIRKARG